MHVSRYYLATVVALGIPAHAMASVAPDLGQDRTLYALNQMPAGGLELGRFFDSSSSGPSRLAERLASPPSSREPFALKIPATPPPPFRRTFRLLINRAETNGYDALIRAQAENKGLDPRLVKSVIAAESEFFARARSRAGAVGLMQVRPATAGEMGVSAGSLFDPAANIRAGTRYLAYLFERAWVKYHLRGVPFTRAPEWLVQRVIAAYNAGPRWVSRRPLYRQTRAYVRKVLLYYRSEVSELKAAV